MDFKRVAAEKLKSMSKDQQRQYCDAAVQRMSQMALGKSTGGKAPRKKQLAAKAATGGVKKPGNPRVCKNTQPAARIKTHSHIAFIKKMVSQLKGTSYLEVFEKSCFGHFIHFSEINMYSTVIYNVLLKRKYPSKNVMSFNIGNQEIYFGEQEFAMMSGLKFQGSEEIDYNPEQIRLMKVHFPGQCSVKLEELLSKFNQLENSEDRIKLGLLYIAEAVIMGGRSTWTVDNGRFFLVDNLEEFNHYPWGKLSYIETIKSLICLSEKKNVSKSKHMLGKVYHHQHGFPHVFQAWIFHSIPVLQQAYTEKNEVCPQAIQPRMLHLKKANRVPSTQTSRIELSNVKVLSPLLPTLNELKEGYMAGFLSDEEVARAKRPQSDPDIRELNGEDDASAQLVENYSSPTNSLENGTGANEVMTLSGDEDQDADSLENLKLNLRSEIQKLKNEKEELRSDNNKLMEENTKFNKGKALLESEIESLRNEKTNLGIETELLHNGKTTLRNDAKLLKEEKDKLQSDVKFLNEEKAKLGAHTELLGKEKTKLQSDFECLNREKSTVQVDICSLNEKKITILDDICSLTEKKTAVHGDMLWLNEKKTILETEVKSLSNEKDNLGNETELLNKEMTKLQDDVCSLNEKKAILESDIESLSNEKTNLGKGTDLLSKEKTKLQSAFESLGKEKFTLQGDVFSLNKNKTMLESEIESLSNVKTKLVTETEHLSKEKTGLRDEKNKLHIDIEYLNKERAKLGADSKLKEKDIELLNEEKVKLHSDIKFLNEEKDKLHTNIKFLDENEAEILRALKSRAKINIHNSTTPKCSKKENAPEQSCLSIKTSQSGTPHIYPLEFWRGEKVVYNMDREMVAYQEGTSSSVRGIDGVQGKKRKV